MTRYCTLRHDADGAVLEIVGAWRLGVIADIDRDLRAARLPAAPIALDARRLEALDTAGALALLEHAGDAGATLARPDGLRESHARILDAVRKNRSDLSGERRRVRGLLGALGAAAVKAGWTLHCQLDFLGRCMAALAEVARRPGRLRWKELAAQVQHVCLEAIPVVALVTFLIGMVLAYLFGLQAEKYGASIFVVDAVAIGAAREIAPLLAAVIMAGRSGSAFTAQLGTMRLTQEIDALRTLGLSPTQVLVLPRVLASVFALPLLVFAGDVAALGGALAVSGPLLDISPLTFVGRVDDALALRHVAVGLAKGAIFGAAIALIGCRAGMTVRHDARSIGMRTTSTVVQSIVTVILLDALFAVLLQELGL
jgi:phospholipid/cholesterol/gamma-HCH transport system permease protein